MPNHDYDFANQAGSLFRGDLNNFAVAVQSNNAGSADPVISYSTWSHMWWADTTTGWFKKRNGSNTAWEKMFRSTGMNPLRHLVFNKSTSYTILDQEMGDLFRATSALTFNLTAAATLGDGWHVDIMGAGGEVTIDPNASELIDGTTTATVRDGETVRVYCNGSQFFTSRAQGVYTGTMIDYCGAAAPIGFLLSYGQSLSTTTYAALFAVTGYTFGGSGASFNVPDCRGRVIIGKDNMGGASANRITTGGAGFNGDTLGANGGAETVTLAIGNLPAHDHPGSTGSKGSLTVGAESGHTHQVRIYTSGGPGTGQSPPDGSFDTSASTLALPTTGGGSHTHTLTGAITVTIAAQGSGTAVNKTQPSLVLNKCIKT